MSLSLAEYSFAPIQQEDVEAVYALEAASYPADEAATLEKVRYRSTEATPFFLVLKRTEDNRIVGFVNGTCVEESTIEHCSMAQHAPSGRTLVVHSVTVRDAHRCRGLATTMLAEYLRRMHVSKAVDRVLLLSKGYLLPFYLRSGFEFIRRSPVEHGQEHWYELGMELNEFFGLDQWQVDAFADNEKPFSGNPAAVVLVQRDEQWMQNLAMENNLAETSFLEKVSHNRFKLRWFTPTKEVELCGHATLAAAHVLLSNGLADRSKPIVFETKWSGELIATGLPDGKIKLSFPATAPSAHAYTDEELSWLKSGLGVCDEEILFQGVTIYDKFFELTPNAFARIQNNVNLNALNNFDTRGIIVTAAGGKRGASDEHQRFDFVSRFFGPRCGVPEDPVTGSAHCALAPYWFNKFGQDKGTLQAFQASPRGGVLEVAIVGDRVTLVGKCVTTIKGKLLA